MSKSVTVGARPDCDLVLNVPSVSGYHCRLTRDQAGFVLEDLNSTNGTFLNGERIRGAVPIMLTAADTIHLGTYALGAQRLLSLIAIEPAPVISFRTGQMIIGRVAGCDHVIELPMISSRHARLFREGPRILIEDLRSSNGTFVNGTRVQGPVVLNPGDTIGLGSHEVKLAADSWQPAAVAPAPIRDEPFPVSPQVVVPTMADVPARSPMPSQTPGFATILGHPWRLAALLAQAVVAAFLIAGLGGTSSPVPVLFWLGLVATWCGLSDAVLGNVIDRTQLRTGLSPDRTPRVAVRLLVLLALCTLQCLLAWAIVASLAALKAPGFAALALLVLAAVVGLALGLLILALAPQPTLAWVALPVLVLAMLLLGGQLRPLHEMPSAVGAVSGLSPSRWAFEGLLLLETDQHDLAAGHDLAEAYFPAQTERMGVRADVLALAAMFIGLSAAVVFIAASASPG